MVAVAPPAEVVRSPFWLHDATVTVRVLDALRDAGVIERLGSGPATAGAIAGELALAPRPLELALEIAGRVGAVERSPDGAWTLGDPAVMGMLLPAEDLTRVLQGDPPRTDMSDADESQRTYATLVGRIARIAEEAGADLLPHLERSGQHVLEIAAGSSPWGRALCAEDPGTTVTAVDLPGVIDAAVAAVEHDGLSDRYTFLAGDVFALEDLPNADLVVVAGFCRLLGPDQNRALFERVGRWCRPGGRVAVLDAVSTPEARAAGLAGYELGLLSRTSRGRCWSFDHYARWLTDNGFAHVELHSTTRPELSLLTARRTEPS